MDPEAAKQNRGPKACTTCAKAKSRCIPGPLGSEKCERCHRLQKPCASQTPAPPRSKKEPKPTKVAELERRLNELTTQLHAAQTQTDPSATTSSSSTTGASHLAPTQTPRRTSHFTNFSHIFPEPPEDPASSDDNSTPGLSEPSPHDGHASSVTPLSSHDSRSGDSHLHPPSQTISRPPSVPSRLDATWPSGEMANMLLANFREKMEPLFPFVVVPPHMNATQLAQERPFLFKGAMVVALQYDAARQLSLGGRMFHDVTQAAFTKPKKNLDLLQGLQLFISWFQYNMDSFQVTNLLFLARSICISLGFKDFQTGPQQNEPTPRALEHMRAFAGTYYLNTLVFTTNKRPDAFMNTAYLESCCKFIKESAEYPSDELLVHLFRIQQLAQSISLTLGTDTAALQSMQLPLTMVIQSFQDQLDTFKNGLPDQLKENGPLLSHMAIAEMLLYEIGITECQNQNSLIPYPERLSLLWNCLTAAQKFIGNRFRESLFFPPRFICLGTSDWMFVLLVALKLRTLEVPGWDLNIVQARIPLDEVVERQVSEMDAYIERRRQGRSPEKLCPHPDSKIPGAADPLERCRDVLRSAKDLATRELDLFSSVPCTKPKTKDVLAAFAGPDMVQLSLSDLNGSFWREAFDPSFWASEADASMSTMMDMDWGY